METVKKGQNVSSEGWTQSEYNVLIISMGAAAICCGCVVVLMLFCTNRKKNTPQNIRFQQQNSESHAPQPIIYWDVDGDTVSIPLKIKPPKKRRSNNHLQVVTASNKKRRFPKDYSFESSMNSYDESKQIELASSSCSVMSSPSLQPEVHNSTQLRSEYDKLTTNMDRETVLFGRKYTTEGTEETETMTGYDDTTEYETERSLKLEMETKGGGGRYDNDMKDVKDFPEMKMLTSMGFDKELAFVALMQSNYNVPNAINYLIHSGHTPKGGKTTRK